MRKTTKTTSKAKTTAKGKTKGAKATKTTGKTKEKTKATKAKPKATKTKGKTTAKPKATAKAKPSPIKAKTGKTTRKTTTPTKTRTEISATRKTPKAPRGFTVVPGQAEAKDLIRERLDNAKDDLDSVGLTSRVYVHEYKNGEIDGEIVVMVPRGTAAVDVNRAIEAAFGTLPYGMGKFWFAPGIRLGFTRERDAERSGSARVRGMDDMQMHYRRMQTPKLIDSFLRAQKIMIPGAEKKYKRKIEHVYLRVNWNPDNKKPSR